MLASFVENPENAHFEGQDPDEKILLLLRAHIITNIPWIVFSLVVFLVPFLAPRAAHFIGFNLSQIPDTYLIALLIINYLLVLIIAFEGFLHWYFNVTLITEQKIIDVDFEPILYKGVNLAPLSKIEETDSKTAGFFGTIFNFGNVSVQTAGANIAITMKNVPRPAHVADLILDRVGIKHQHLGGI